MPLRQRIFHYGATNKWGWPRDVSLREFSTCAQHLLDIITHGFEPLEGGHGRVIINGLASQPLEKLLADLDNNEIYGFTADIPVRTHSLHGSIRVAYPDTESFESYKMAVVGTLLTMGSVGLAAGYAPDPRYMGFAVIPLIGITLPEYLHAKREAKRKKVKEIELRLTRSTYHREELVKRLYTHLTNYSIPNL